MRHLITLLFWTARSGNARRDGQSGAQGDPSAPGERGEPGPQGEPRTPGEGLTRAWPADMRSISASVCVELALTLETDPRLHRVQAPSASSANSPPT